jgi:hypothetical protein
MRESMNMKFFMNLGTHEPVVMEDQKYTKCRRPVSWTCMQKEKNNLDLDTHDKIDGQNVDHGTWGAK